VEDIRVLGESRTLNSSVRSEIDSGNVATDLLGVISAMKHTDVDHTGFLLLCHHTCDCHCTLCLTAYNFVFFVVHLVYIL
jgi:hypothetical protein